MFKNAFSKISSGFNQIKENLPFLNKRKDIQVDTQTKVDSALMNQSSANEEKFSSGVNNTVKSISNYSDKIISQEKSINILGDFTGNKRLRFKNQDYKLQFENGVIIKAYKDVKGKYIPVNAKSVRTLSSLLKKSSNEVNKVSFSSKRNSQNKFNTKLHGQYNFINDSKTQFTIIVNKGEIKRTYYKNTTTTPSQEEIDLIQSSINSHILGLSGYKTMRSVKKELLKEKKSREKIQEVSYKSVKEKVNLPNFNGKTKHDNLERLKYKNKLREEERQQEEKNKIIRGSFIKQDLQLLSKHQFMLSKTDKIGNIEYIRQRKNKDGNITNTFDYNQQQAALLEVFTILGARKGIYNLGDIKKFINTPSKLHVFKGQILSYLEGNIPEEIEDDRNALLNIFNNALEVNLQHIPKEKVYGTLIDGATGKKSKYSK